MFTAVLTILVDFFMHKQTTSIHQPKSKEIKFLFSTHFPLSRSMAKSFTFSHSRCTSISNLCFSSSQPFDVRVGAVSVHRNWKIPCHSRRISAERLGECVGVALVVRDFRIFANRWYTDVDMMLLRAGICDREKIEYFVIVFCIVRRCRSEISGRMFC